MLHTFGKHADGLAVYEFVITHKILLWIVQKSWANFKVWKEWQNCGKFDKDRNKWELLARLRNLFFLILHQQLLHEVLQVLRCM